MKSPHCPDCLSEDFICSGCGRNLDAYEIEDAHANWNDGYERGYQDGYEQAKGEDRGY